jgi:hypothetical protein
MAAVSLCLLTVHGINCNHDFLWGLWVSTIWLDRRRNLSIVGNLHAFVIGTSGDGRTSDLHFFGRLIVLSYLSIVGVLGRLTASWPDVRTEISGPPLESMNIVIHLAFTGSMGTLSRSADTDVYFFLASQIAQDISSHRVRRANPPPYLIGVSMLVGGLVGFILVPYLAAPRHAPGYLILILASYVGLCVMLQQRNRFHFIVHAVQEDLKGDA